MLFWFLITSLWAKEVFFTISHTFAFAQFIVLYFFLLLFFKTEMHIYKCIYIIPLSVAIVLFYDMRFLDIDSASTLREFESDSKVLIDALGLTSEISILSILYLYIFSERKIIKLYSVIMLLVCSFSFIISGSRVGLMVSFCNVLLYLLILVLSKMLSFKEKTNLIKIVMMIIIGPILIFYIINNIYPKLSELFLDRILGSINPDFVSTSVADYYWEENVRFQLWDAAIHMFMSKPLTGVGFGNFRTEISSIAPSLSFWAFPHNVYLTILSETGLVGIILWLILIIGVLHRYWVTIRYLNKNKLKKEYYLVLVFAITFMGLLVHCIFMPILFLFTLYYIMAMSYITANVFYKKIEGTSQ